MKLGWFRGAMPGADGRPCLVSWRNGLPLVVPLVPKAAGSELARFSIPGWYDDGSAGDVEEACVRAAASADACGPAARESCPYVHDGRGIVRFLAEHSVADPEAAARALSAVGGPDGVIRHAIPSEALDASPLSASAVRSRQARERAILEAYPDPSAYEGADADLLAAAAFARKAARLHPAGDTGTFAEMADRAALRALEAVDGRYPVGQARGLVDALLQLMAMEAVAEPTRAAWLDGRGLVEARAGLARIREGGGAPAPR